MPWSHGPALVLAVLAATVLSGAPALAGVVVLKNGEVLVGEVEAPAEGVESLTVRWPHEEAEERGKVVLPLFRVRWYDVEHDRPTDAYWERFLDEPIADAYLGLKERYVLRQERLAEAGGLVGGARADEESARLAGGAPDEGEEEAAEPAGGGAAAALRPDEPPSAREDAGGCGLAGAEPVDPLALGLLVAGLLLARRRALGAGASGGGPRRTLRGT